MIVVGKIIKGIVIYQVVILVCIYIKNKSGIGCVLIGIYYFIIIGIFINDLGRAWFFLGNV